MKQELFNRKGNSNISPHTPKNHPSLLLTSNYFKQYQYRFSGKILLREEIPLSPTLFQKFIHKQWLVAIPSISQNLISTKCHRCENNDKNKFSKIKCARCKKTHVYCRNCIQMGRVLACEPLYIFQQPYQNIWLKHKKPLTWLGKLSYVQNKAASALIKAIQKQKPLLIWAVTGSGKTEMLFPGIAYALEKGMRICIASPRSDVIRELFPRIQSAFQKIHVQALYAGSKDNDGTAQLILATTHQLIRYRAAFDLLIIDEVDAFPYYQNDYLEKIAERSKKVNASTIYLTATPRRKQKRFIQTKQVDLVFVPIRYHLHPLILPEWQQEMRLKKRMHQNKLPHTLKEIFTKRINYNRQILIFVPTIHFAEKLYTLLFKNPVLNHFIKDKTELDYVHSKDTKRMLKINLFRKKKIKLLITTTILERGVTFPAVDVYVVDAGHHIFDEAALIQITGRAGRSPLDPKGNVVFIHDGLTQAIVRTNQEIEKMNRLRKAVLKEMGHKQ